jgi:hypothetical protein
MIAGDMGVNKKEAYSGQTVARSRVELSRIQTGSFRYINTLSKYLYIFIDREWGYSRIVSKITLH